MSLASSTLAAEQRRRIRELERALGRETYELEVAGEALRGWEGASASLGLASWSPPGIARGVEAAIIEVALANQTDGYRMVAALVARKLGRAVNRTRVPRVMRQHQLIQRRRRLEGRRRPGFFKVTRPTSSGTWT